MMGKKLERKEKRDVNFFGGRGVGGKEEECVPMSTKHTTIVPNNFCGVFLKNHKYL